MLIASAVNERAITSRSKNLGTTSLLVVFPSSLTKFFEYCLHISRNFRYFAKKVEYRINFGIQLIYIIKMHKTIDTHNFFL